MSAVAIMPTIKKPLIYFDNAATTPLLPEVKEAMISHMDDFGNPSALYSIGTKAKELIEDSRRVIADYMHCEPENIIFTSGATESNNTVISAMIGSSVESAPITFTTKIEHSSVLNSIKSKYFLFMNSVDNQGIVSIPDFVNEFENHKGDNFFISVMSANNEIGTKQPIKKIYAEMKEKLGENALLHSDMTQSFGWGFDDGEIPADFASASAHKIGGPKGVGLLYAKNPALLKPLLYGGGQENNFRSGTYNTLGIIGFAEAVKHLNPKRDSIYVSNLREYIKSAILSEIPDCKINEAKSPADRLPGILNVSIAGIRGEELMIMLDTMGICVGTGSACGSSKGEPSHVLKAIGLSDEQADSSIRVSLSPRNTEKEADMFISRLKECVGRLRT